MPDRYIKKILEARVYDVAIETPLDEAKGLSERLENRILLKREDKQPVFSFKIRGAYNKMAQLSQAQRDCGVVAASAGNHAQGLAMSAKYLGVKATIVMPKTTPDVKVNNVRRLGGKVVLHGDAYDDAAAYAQKLVKEKGMTYVHPFDDPDVIAGQGTVAMEILRQESGPIDAIFVPVGGGGLIAGIAAYVKYLRPETKVIGVESEDSACLKAALDAGKRVTLDQVGIFADGVAVAIIGENTFEVAKKYVDEVITVSTDEICAAIKDIYDDTRSICEPAGALGVAGMKKYVAREACREKTLIAIDSGANVNFDRLRHIAERSELGEKREAIIAARIPEKAGSFKKFCSALGKRNITEFNYRYSDDNNAIVFAGIQLTSGGNGRDELLKELRDQAYEVEDLTENEIAKLHVRYMVGGHSPKSLTNEVIYRFEFPERPGALMNFLSKLGGKWNISMFHYRNHGAAYGRVLVGMQVPDSERAQVGEFLSEIGYNYWEETDNTAYKLFLG
ncbi:threonine ammonia-lyase, biosynthetic [Neptuniibacter pectenicola]|jgi:threonine dehydratase|uniref:threonine ammonia-lyase, biosynthetic n=1 Tax=Neptuniibacter pectenicola TaxID=1806669 RepID=UPI00079C8F00|nr:threonine ammonia-lyase, biosynthetic [Neptuniibacter pectenicola]KXJ53228.1 MAG: threonine dehydratase [Neptuniibacter sp. Phe_28]|tara:strand:- start:64 stop:1581 length:1518 start_codon:yes stop_codon:yes gene_type:complete